MQAKILVVGGDQQTSKALADAMGSHCCQVLRASNGSEALRQMAAAPPSLVILDLPPLGNEGYETVRRIREVSSIPMIVIRAASDSR